MRGQLFLLLLSIAFLIALMATVVELRLSLFDPSTDLFSSFRVTKPSFTFKSTHRCVGDLRKSGGFTHRACVLHNVCYHQKSSSLKYFTTAPSYSAIRENAQRYHLIDELKRRGDPSHRMTLTEHPGLSVHLAPVTETPENGSSVHFAYGTWSVRYGRHEFFNFGHALWDIMFGHYMNMQMLGLDVPPEDFHILFSKFGSQLHKWLEPFSLGVTKHPLKAFANYIKEHNSSEYICFQSLLLSAGTDISMFSFRDEKYFQKRLKNALKPALYNSFRNRYLRAYNIDPNFRPTHHSILLVEKTSQIKGRKARRVIANLRQVESFLNTTFPSIPVRVVDFNSISFEQQLRELIQTTIFISPPGGVSCGLPFLPYGAHAIIPDIKLMKDQMGYRKGASVSNDADIWDAIVHVDKQYYQTRNASDYIWSDEKYKLQNRSRSGMHFVMRNERLLKLLHRIFESGSFSVAD